MREFELIEKIGRMFSQNVDVGIGDDTAAVKGKDGYTLLTVDTITVNTHYRRSWEEKIKNLYHYLGWKLLAISVSDIVSMGGYPEFALLSFCLEKNFSEEKILELSRGLSEAAYHYKVNIVGGDTVRGEVEVFSLMLTGRSDALMLRNEAKPGDFVGVIGFCGDAAAGFEILEYKNPPYKKEEEILINRFLKPTPDVKIGRYLLQSGVKCCMDNSDGLLLSLYLISEKSGVALNIDRRRIPVSEENRKVFKERAVELALSGGEDYNLVFTFPENIKEKIEKIPSVSIIGRVESGEGVYLNGGRVEPTGFDHFGGV